MQPDLGWNFKSWSCSGTIQSKRNLKLSDSCDTVTETKFFISMLQEWSGRSSVVCQCSWWEWSGLVAWSILSTNCISQTNEPFLTWVLQCHYKPFPGEDKEAATCTTRWELRYSGINLRGGRKGRMESKASATGLVPPCSQFGLDINPLDWGTALCHD